MKQSNVIDNKNAEHTIEPYRFKVLGAFPTNDVKEQETVSNLEEQTETQAPKQEVEKESQTHQEEPKLEPSFIEELLKRTDELSGNIIKLQMQIENQENEFKVRLEQEVARTKDEALKEGHMAAKTEFEAELNEIEKKYMHSIEKLDEEKSKLEALYASSQQELASTAIEIAKEVVIKEIKDSSSVVASNIAKSLISELNDATSIEIKTNPKDYEFLKANLNLNSHIKITSDDAINSGGVIVLSEVGNIDGSVMARFAKIKKILSE
ncbi:flagellar assembly protein FliH [Campylobacter fetus]|uniref:Flagellar assembly protein FliH n=2 Tax=Campylobacter fetus TaxID=196 RepID=A0RMN6_CAMFF|nr:flagellar assembly protein FliH [Campylobacter fetus]ABK82698.1 flagellar assembly protein [Campylobacter fetus subsp. fetus 82-40]EAI3886314.1 flagellar assembly protein FliH [Campylobacter fetus]EAI3915395.1 flagellar assembly protein FliH [Campylobacter fetus]EAI3919030.1 flagellar assembly protein FliH [Campylobacter fetus]EAI8858509.1 flagellar assembly protein FliH [Campylobacter fetus]